MRLIIIAICILFSITSFCQNNIEDKLTRIKDIKYMPYYPQLSGDSLFWELVKIDSSEIQTLINNIDDSSMTNVNVPNFGGNYTVGDICFEALKHIIYDIDTKSFIPDSIDKSDGYHYYWNFVRASNSNRAAFKNEVLNWYETVKYTLIWVEDIQEKRVARDWQYSSKTHPAKGYYKQK